MKGKHERAPEFGFGSNEELACSLSTFSPYLIMAFAENGQALFANESANRIFGGQGALIDVSRVLPEVTEEQVKSCILTGSSMQTSVLHEGQSYRFELIGRSEERILAVYGIDVSDLIRTEADLVRSQNLLRRVLDTDPNMIFVKDIAGRFVLANQAVADAYGTSIDNLLGKTDADFNPSAKEIEHFANDDRDVIKNQVEKRILEEPVTDAAGKTRIFSTVKRPLQLAERDEALVLGVSNDITALKKLQEQLAQAGRLEALGKLAGGIAHDFNNLLTAILGYADILEFNCAGDPQVNQPVKMIHQAAERAKLLTEQLLGFARQGKHQNTVIEVHKLIRDTLTLLQRTIDPSIEIQTSFTERVLRVVGDPTQLQQVLINLFINARDAVLELQRANLSTGEPGKIDIKTEVLATESSKLLLIKIRDNGCGMDEPTKAKVFEPFFTTKEMGRGTGLGLSMAYGIVDTHGGQIEVESSVGQGTEFRIRLPLADDAETSEEIGEVLPLKLGPSGTILLIDDHEDVLQVTTKMLQTLGFTVEAFSSGEDGLAYFSDNRKDVRAAVVDLIMPKMSGSAVVSKLQELAPQLPILLVSGYGQNNSVQKLLDQGVSFLRKPFQLASLSRALEAILPERLASP